MKNCCQNNLFVALLSYEPRRLLEAYLQPRLVKPKPRESPLFFLPSYCLFSNFLLAKDVNQSAE